MLTVLLTVLVGALLLSGCFTASVTNATKTEPVTTWWLAPLNTCAEPIAHCLLAKPVTESGEYLP